ncbi:MAG: 50S ribosomal protein L29 [Clostridia bacterium]|nr:50S ribosomal protein L29 [Clostridia bacterium]
MKANEYRKMTSSDLEKELGELKSELFKLRFQLTLNGLENPMKIKTTKRDIARIKTILREKELNEAE